MDPRQNLASEAGETVTAAKRDELAFHPSPEPTLGVELELQILDRDTGDLAPGAVHVLKAGARRRWKACRPS